MLRRAATVPPGVALRKAASLVRRGLVTAGARRLDLLRATYGPPAGGGPLHRYLSSGQPPAGLTDTPALAAVTAHYLAHRFDLLGSGWVEVRHGRTYRGVEGYRYGPGSPVRPDPEGRWLAGRVSRANARTSRRVWRLVDPGYRPIDWQVDFKSGYRWSESTWYRDITYGHLPGVDVKVPWELSRMQHLVLLARAYGVARDGRGQFEVPGAYAQEFRNQVLDFVATNPPRFGVNWACPMDVAIRAANWLVAFDLFSAAGAEFDAGFLGLLARSLTDHARHVAAHLEWDPVARGNHYLADVAGLLFAAAYLPRSPQVDAWLAFAVQELVAETERQFTADGANAEASVAYHRLAAEMVVYGTALVLGLRPDKRAALLEYQHRLHRAVPPLRPAPIALHPAPGGTETPFPPGHAERLEAMAAFIRDVTRPDGLTVQIGDNDSGRFLKPDPVYRRMTVREARRRYSNLDGYADLPDDATYWREEHLDHAHLTAAVDRLLGSSPTGGPLRRGAVDAYLVDGFAGGARLSGALRRPTPAFPARVGAGLAPGRGLPAMPRSALPASRHYPDFGLWLHRSRRLHLAVRCGGNGRCGGGHAHNDQLSIELSLDGLPFVVDPGTYLYTPMSELRNRFRSTAMHNTLAVAGLEQNRWEEGRAGLFLLADHAGGRLVTLGDGTFVGEHVGFGAAHRRSLHAGETAVEGLDECEAAGGKTVAFHLAPGVEVRLERRGRAAELTRAGVRVQVNADVGSWSVVDDACSPAYGVLERSLTLRLSTEASRIGWRFEIVE